MNYFEIWTGHDSITALLCKIYVVVHWFLGLVSGDSDKHAAGTWELFKMCTDMVDERTDVYSNASEEDRYLMKPFAGSFLWWGQDNMMRAPGFSLDVFGPNGDKLVEWFQAHDYDDHHVFGSNLFSSDCCLSLNNYDWMLTLQYGRVSDATQILEARLRLQERVVADISSTGRSMDLAMGSICLMVCCHIHGRSDWVRNVSEIFGFTFDSVGEYYSTVTKGNTLFTSMEQIGPGAGLISLKRLYWQVKCLLILHTDVPASKAFAWLEALPDDERFIQVSMTMPHYSHTDLLGLTQVCWIALAHEKVGLYDGALRFCRLALEPDLLKAGTPWNKWALTMACACKGRVFSKLNKHTEALAAFQAAIVASKESYSMMEAFAYRELANCDAGSAPAPMAAAIAQAAVDLEEKLKEFGGRLTRAEFNTVSIAAPAPATAPLSNLLRSP